MHPGKRKEQIQRLHRAPRQSERRQRREDSGFVDHLIPWATRPHILPGRSMAAVARGRDLEVSGVHRISVVNLPDEDIKKIVEWAKRHPQIKRVYLFGSRARCTNREGSDIDLAIEMDWSEWFDWHREFKKNPDLHLSQKINEQCLDNKEDLYRVRNAVKTEGILIYSRI